MQLEKDVKVSKANGNTNNEADKEKCNKNETSDSDYLEDCIGANGVWQICVSLAILTRFIAMFNMLSIVFLTPPTDFLCIEFKDNITIQAKNGTCYKNCTKYAFYSKAMKSTLISDFGLICDREWLASLSQTIMMCGVVFGVSIFGWVSDRFGRRVALISSSLLNVITMIPTSFVSSYWMFNCLRFITGIASGGSLIIAIPFIMEIIGKRYREYVGATYLLPDGIAQALLALFAYYLPYWDTYLLGLGVTCILILILICFVPESPRWLVANGKVDNALKIMFRAAKVNNLSTEHIKDTVKKSMENMNIEENKKVSASYLDFFKDIQTVIITLSTFVIWFVLGVTYYGIYQYMTFLGTNIYFTVVILGLIQVPLCLVQVAMTRLFKRRTALALAFLITGVTMAGLIFTPNGHWSTTFLGVAGFSASSATYAVTYLYQAELFPTPLRNMSLGIVSAAGKIGAMIAPFIANISPTWVPSLIFCLLSVLAVGVCFLLPETKGNNLKDTID